MENPCWSRVLRGSCLLAAQVLEHPWMQASGGAEHLPRTAARIQDAIMRRCALCWLPSALCLGCPPAAGLQGCCCRAAAGCIPRLPAGWLAVGEGRAAPLPWPLLFHPPAPSSLPPGRRSSSRLTLQQRISEAIDASRSVTPTVSRTVTPATESLKAAAAAASLACGSPCGGSSPPAGGSPRFDAAAYSQPLHAAAVSSGSQAAGGEA